MRIFISILCIILLIIGVIGLISPIPIGIFIITISLSILLSVNVTAQNTLTKIRNKHQKINRFPLSLSLYFRSWDLSDDQTETVEGFCIAPLAGILLCLSKILIYFCQHLYVIYFSTKIFVILRSKMVYKNIDRTFQIGKDSLCL